MPAVPQRIVVYPRDVVNITGRRERTARRLLQTIREAFGKGPHEFVTIRDFCTFTGIDEELVRDFLRY